MAKQLKSSMDRLKAIGSHLSQLEERKRMATMNEDYDAAKILKEEMTKIRQASFDHNLESLIAQFTGQNIKQ